ncbi:MAG: LLM class flavin-dependent oxidoreductase, partial [Acidimicrobiaceae bacterium]|nr:LLM class flavin-dependent oxidoreductase [Acidimicrobiaceae bacterium]
VDGVFCYDHLFPPGEPARASLSPFPLLARVSSLEPRLVVGPLVARIGHGSPAHLVAQVRALRDLAPGRVIAALGVGDEQARREMSAFGLTIPSKDQRLRDLGSVARALDVPVWIGGRSPTLVDLADELGAALNLWGASLDEVAGAVADREVTWSGVAPDPLDEWLDSLAERGVTWAVVISKETPEHLGAWCARR